MNSPRKRPFSGSGMLSSVPRGTTIAEFAEYRDASGYVSHLVNQNFPAGMIAIVGSGIRTVERVRGKLSYARVALQGAVTGSWIGFFIGLIFGQVPSDLSQQSALTAATNTLVSFVLTTAGMFMIFNVLRHALNRNKRGYLSSSMVIAEKYEVIVPDAMADDARKLAATPNA